MLYFILGLPKFRLISPLFTLYLLNKGFSFYTITLGTSVFHITTCVMEVPLGIFIDKFGTRVSLILSNILYIIKVALFFTVSSTSGLLMMYLIRSLEKLLGKKCDAVVIGNKLESENRQEEFSKIYGNILSISSGSLAVSSVVSGFFYDHYLAYILLTTVILHIAAVILTILFYEEPVNKQVIAGDQGFVERFIKGYNHIKSNRIVSIFVFFAFITLVRIVIVDMKSILMKELEVSTWFVSMISIVGEVNQTITGKVAFRIIDKTKYYTVYMLVGMLSIFAILPIVNDSEFVVLMYCFTPIFNGMKNVFMANELNKMSTSDNRGVVASFLFVIEAVISAIIMVLVGRLHALRGITTVFTVVTIFIVVALVPLSRLYIKRMERQSNDGREMYRYV